MAGPRAVQRLQDPIRFGCGFRVGSRPHRFQPDGLPRVSRSPAAFGSPSIRLAPDACHRPRRRPVSASFRNQQKVAGL